MMPQPTLFEGEVYFRRSR